MPDQNVHEHYQPREAIKSSSDRIFGFVFAVVFAIIGLWPFLFDSTYRLWALVMAAAFLALSLVRPQTLAPLNKLWTKFGMLLHRVTNPIIMAALFFGVITPIALCMRAFGKLTLNTGFDHEATSYWFMREPPGPAPETMKQQF